MVRSFHYAAHEELLRLVERGGIPHDHAPKFESWVRYWNVWASVAFLQAYFHRLGPADLLPRDESQLRAMLRAYVLHEIIGELGRELIHPAGRLKIPLQGFPLLLGQQPRAPAVEAGAVNPK
jgi:predicted trehalose synthase